MLVIQLVIQLMALKNSYHEKLSKIKQLNNKIINVLKPEKSEKELEEVTLIFYSYLQN